MARASTVKNRWTLFLLVLLGIVLGSFFGYLVKDVDFLSWMNYGLDFSIGGSGSDALSLNLGVITILFGLSIKITVASVIGAFISILIFKKI